MPDTTIDLRSIAKFNGTNYQAWKFQMRAIFIANGLTTIVNGTKKREEGTTEAQKTEWDKGNAKAMVIISSTIEAPQLQFLLTCETAAEMWNKLSAVHEQKSESNKLVMMTRFHDYKMASGDSVAQHVAKIENMARQLQDVGETVSNVTMMAKILGSLPEKYSALVTAWDSVESENQTIDKLRERLIKEEARMTTIDEASTALAAVNLKTSKTRYRGTGKTTERSRKEPECFYCHKVGHYIRECRIKKRNEDQRGRRDEDNYSRRDKDSSSRKDEDRRHRSKDKQRKNNDSSTEAAFSAEIIKKEFLNLETKEAWILDSGASKHMTFRSDWISNLQMCEDEHVTLGDGTMCRVHGRGTVHIKRLVNDQWLDGKIEDVLYVPDLDKNLFSVGACMSKKYRAVFKNDSVEMYLDNELRACGFKRGNNLFTMLFKVQLRNTTCLATTTSSMKRWHDRLGHVNFKYINQMCKEGLINGSKTDGREETVDIFCEACQYGKQHRSPFKSTSRNKPQPGEMIHSDVCGKMSQESLGGSNYFVSFKDDCTAFRMVYFIKHKDDVFDKLKDYINLVENKFQRNVKTLRVDNGREYCNERTMRYLREKGINIETTAPYTPEQNGRAERDNRSLVESARTMLHAKNLPVILWAEAVNAACYILNRTPTASNQGMTPYEAWTDKKPRLDHIRVLGSEAYAHIPKQFRKKWDKKSQKLILVGYQMDSCNYRLYNPETGKIIVSRDVIIHETDYDDDQEDSEHDSRITIRTHSQDEDDDNSDSNATTNEHQNGEDDIHEGQPVEQDRIRTLRDRNTLKQPIRYQANLVEYDEPQSYEEALSAEDADDWKKAIDEELKAHKLNGTWRYEDLPEGKKTIGSRWVFKRKYGSDENAHVYKARLCAKGFTQQQGVDYQEVFAPVARYDSIRTMMSLAAMKNLEIGQFDVKTAFLHGDLVEEIYMETPKGVKSECRNKVCRLQKSLYGLKQASRTWNCKFDSFLKRFHFVPSKADTCVYTGKYEADKVHLIIYVDDGLILAPSKEALNAVLNELKLNFEITIGDARNYIGIEIVRNIKTKSIFIHQASYVKRILQRFNMFNSKTKSIPADLGINLSSTSDSDIDVQDVPYRQAIGSLMFLSNVTRPDITFIVNFLSRFVACFDRQHWCAVKNVLKYLKGTISYGIRYDGTCENVLLEGYSDSDYAGDLDTRRSTTGYLFVLANGAITWGSLRQRTVSLSTTEAEYIAACEAVKDALWLRQLLRDSEYQCDKAIVVKVDNQSAIKLIRNPEFHKRSKHIDIRYHFIREKYSNGDIDIEYVCSREQLADIFTKALSRDIFQNLRLKIGMIPKE